MEVIGQWLWFSSGNFGCLETLGRKCAESWARRVFDLGAEAHFPGVSDVVILVMVA